MSVNSDTRANRWILAAAAAFALILPASLAAQNDKDTKDQKRETPRPRQKGSAETPPAPQKGTTNSTPANPQTSSPAVHRDAPTDRPANVNRPAYNGTRPAGTPPSTPQRGPVSATPTNPPANNQPANSQPVRTPIPQDRPGSVNRPAVNDSRPVSPTRQPGFNRGIDTRSNDRPGGTPAPAAGRPVYRGPNGSEVHYRPNGQPQTVQARGMTITHTPTGVRRTVFERPDHTVIVTHGVNHGYVQRPYVVNNVSYVQRTYYVSGRSYVRVYRPYVYHGISLNLYVTPRYYAPAYYGWVYRPWGTPVAYRWGWYNDPWYGYYGGYFTPYPSYASAAFWLTDYIVATTLQQAYQERMDAQAAAQANYGYGDNGGAPTPLTPEVKQAIADEVERQLAQERADSQAGAQAAGAAPSFLTDDATHVFVVANGIDVMSRAGGCALTEGDVIQMTVLPAPNAANADLTVLASKGPDCRKGTMVSVAIGDLLDMQNHMRETMDQGLSDLQSRKGTDGLPAPPADAQRPPVDAPYAAAAPPPDPNVARELSQQADTAQQAEGEVLQQAQSAPQGANSAPATVTLGMTIDQVVSLFGQPATVADLGSKKTYFYSNMKIVFTDGKVTDVQ